MQGSLSACLKPLVDLTLEFFLYSPHPIPAAETGLSLLGYQLCERLVTQHTRRVEATQSSHVTSVSCGGWIPWRRCPKTVYSTQYVAVDVPEARNVTSCCEGYEQLGFYCVLRESRTQAPLGGSPEVQDLLELSRMLVLHLDQASGSFEGGSRGPETWLFSTQSPQFLTILLLAPGSLGLLPPAGCWSWSRGRVAQPSVPKQERRSGVGDLHWGAGGDPGGWV